jgi:hypothetical protein
MLKLEHLLENFASGEVSLNPIEPTGTKHAPHGATDLAADTDRPSWSISKQHAFDPSTDG